MEAEQFSLCWNNFHNNLRTGFHSLLQDEDLVDVTLAAEGKYIKAHKTVLSVSSPYFKELFRVNPCKHPIIILQDVKFTALSNLLQFMYQGEVSVRQEEIPVFMRVAETLKIKGLTENSSPNDAETNGLDDDSVHRDGHYSNYDSSRQSMKRPRPAKKTIKPAQHLRPLDSPKTVKSPSGAKQMCLEETDNLPINPKSEPLDSTEDEYSEDHGFDSSSLNNDSSYPSGSWTPDQNKYMDTSSPGTLQCVLGKRGNPRLIVDGHTFFKKSTYKGKSFWYCKHSRTPHKCPAVCWTYHGQIVKWPTNHNHVVVPEPLNPDEDVEVPIERMQEILIQSAC